MSDTVALTGSSLTLEDLERVARMGTTVSIDAAAAERVAASHRSLNDLVDGGTTVYGVNTGLGALDGAEVDAASDADYQRAILRSHAAGVGEPMAEDACRAMMLARTNALCAGVSGVRPETVEALVAALNSGFCPRVPARGSVGASDLAPLAHVGLALIGEGDALIAGERIEATDALHRAGLAPLTLGGRDGLALINGLAQSAALGALAVVDAQRVLHASESAVALGMVALDSATTSLEERSVRARGHDGAQQSAARLRELLAGLDTDAWREPLSTRAAHQVTGALRDALVYCRAVVDVELNAAADNPMIAGDGWHTSNAANFDGTALAQALELLTTSLAAVAVISERRTARLLDPAHNRGLPAFLIPDDVESGANSGLMIAQYTAAALVAGLRSRASPASLQSIPTSSGIEDYVSMSALAAHHLTDVVATVRSVVAIELLAAAQGADLRGTLLPPGVEAVHAIIRRDIPTMREDRILSNEIELATALITAGHLSP